MKELKIQQSKGFALLAVLVISFLGSLIVFDTIQENINQERMAGNYSKELNARLQAENGLASVYNNISGGTFSTGVISDLNGSQNPLESYHYYLSDFKEKSSDSELMITSKGSYYEGNYDIRGAMTAGASSGNSVFTGAITTCDGVNLGGSGTIDSYDPKENGAYSANTANNNGDVSVVDINASSGLTLSGGSPIKGSVSVNGSLNLTGSAKIYGDAHASGNISYGDSGYIYGNASSQGNITTNHAINNTQSLTANGDITLQTNYNNNLTYGNDLITPNYASGNGWSILNTAQQASNQVSDVHTEECDVLNLSNEFDSGDISSLKTANSTTIDFSSAGDNNKFDYIFTNNGLESYLTGTKDLGVTTPVETESQDVDFLGENTSAYIISINDFSHGNTITIESGNDVTIYLQGDTSISDKIYVEDGASLTIITEGVFETTQDGGIYPLDSNGNIANSAVNSNGDTSFLLYSGYESQSNSDYGVGLSGYTDIFMTAYAPDAAINITASGSVYGSLRGDYVNMSGSGAIHFDEQIAKTNTGDNSNSNEITITRWF